MEDVEFLTPAECARICRFKGNDAIRRAVNRGELPGVRPRKNRLLIPAKAFWKWFHRNDVKAPDPDALLKLPNDVVFVPANGKRAAHFRVRKEKAA